MSGGKNHALGARGAVLAPIILAFLLDVIYEPPFIKSLSPLAKLALAVLLSLPAMIYAGALSWRSWKAHLQSAVHADSAFPEHLRRRPWEHLLSSGAHLYFLGVLALYTIFVVAEALSARGATPDDDVFTAVNFFPMWAIVFQDLLGKPEQSST